MPQWPSRVGMSVIYLLPSLTSVLGLLFLISTAVPAEPAVGGALQQLWQLAATHRGILIAAMLSVHFIKRELEVGLSLHVHVLHCNRLRMERWKRIKGQCGVGLTLCGLHFAS